MRTGCGEGRDGGARGRGEAGSGTVLAAGWLLVAALLAATLVCLGAGWWQASRLSGAADLVALAAAKGQRSGVDACGVARRASERARVRMEACRVSGDEVEFVVHVVVSAPVDLPGPFRGPRLRASANAGVLSPTGPA